MAVLPLAAERSWISPGSLLGGHPHGGVLLHGPSVVCGCYCHLHRSHRQFEDGDRDWKNVPSRNTLCILCVLHYNENIFIFKKQHYVGGTGFSFGVMKMFWN